MELFDTHCHLDAEEFAGDRQAVLQRAAAAGVAQMLAVATTADSSEAVVALAEAVPAVYAAVGIHPNSCGQAAATDWDRVRRLVGGPRVVALGETGLDKHWDFTPFETQQDYFDRHLRLSQATGLPVVIHTRDCEAEMLAALREAHRRGPLRGILHSFSLSADAAAEALEMGLHISFAGMLTYKKSDALRAIAAAIPADRLLIETDSPYLAPHPVRGQRNEPANITHTASVLAESRGMPLEELAALTTDNARRLFKIERGVTPGSIAP